MLFLSNGIGIDRRGAELGVTHPFLEHVQWDTVHRGIDPEAMTQAFRAAMRGVRNARLDHDRLDDLPDAHPAERPDRRAGLPAGCLGFTDTMRGVERVQDIRRHRNAAPDDAVASGTVLALFQAMQGDRTPPTDPRAPG